MKLSLFIIIFTMFAVASGSGQILLPEQNIKHEPDMNNNYNFYSEIYLGTKSILKPFANEEDSMYPLFERQMKVRNIHRIFAWTTAGVLLSAEAVGIYHFFSMMKYGHDYRDNNSWSSADETDWIQDYWQTPKAQAMRILHGSLIAVGTSLYTATAIMEITIPRLDTDSRFLSRPNIHRAIFFTHASLMLVNIGLGFLESYALSQGNHDLIVGAGIAHLAIGLSIPVIMVSSGLVFKIGAQ